MENITPRVLQYREAARQLWNGFLREEDVRGGGPISTDDLLDDWLELKRWLFVAIVLRHTGSEDHALGLLDPQRFSWWNKPLPFLRVVPRPEVPAMITRTPGRGTYWDHPVRKVDPTECRGVSEAG